MIYLGSKNRHAKEILSIVLKDKQPNQWYVEPFVGGNCIDKVTGPRIGNDIHPQLIALLKAVSEGWVPPENLTEEEYKELKRNNKIDAITGFAGFCCSFGAKYFGGYARNKQGANYAKQGKNNLIKQVPYLKGIVWETIKFSSLQIPDNSIIYCDPPYFGTTKYNKTKFNHDVFWSWCRDKHHEGHRIFVSEYYAPKDFEEVWNKKVTTNFSVNREKAQERVEKLFVYKN